MKINQDFLNIVAISVLHLLQTYSDCCKRVHSSMASGMLENLTTIMQINEFADAVSASCSPLMEVKSYNVNQVGETFAKDSRYLLHSRITYLNNIKAEAFISLNNYTFDPHIKPFNYYNRRYKPPNHVQIEPRFSKAVKVNVNRSHVQCSTEIYQNSKEALNIAKATASINNVYVNNYRNEPSLLWQFFCSVYGFHRAFPGKNSNREIDLYDCRRRLWYNQAINSPKDVVIALDMSGSMIGTHFIIAKLIVQSLIDTLQQDDFFNILYFNEDTNFLIPCLNETLAQATSYYKAQFKQAVTQLHQPKQTSDFPQALRKAFQLIEKTSSRVTSSSNCTKVIMLISDGIDYDERTAEILAHYNGDNKVIIFSYIVGQAGEESSAEMKDLACQSGGNFYQFPNVGNVLDSVLEYQKRLSKPLGKSNEDHVIFTPLYLDGSGLGMMTTISTAVFSNKNQSGDSELIGVAGMDIVVSLLQQQYPIQKMGVFGHAFAINNNGLFLMHPKFKDQSGYLPDPATVYLDDVEYTTDPAKALELKTAIINGKIGCMDAESDWLFPKLSNKRVVRLNNTYCYRPMNDTPFYAGVSMPVQNKIQLVARKEKQEIYVKSGIQALHSLNFPNQTVEVAAWEFCKIKTEKEMLQPASIKYYPTAEDLFEHLNSTKDKFSDKCDEEMLLTLLLSASIISNFTRENWSVQNLIENNILDTYVITASGYMTMMSTDFNLSRPLERDIFEEIRYSHPASFYKVDNRNDLTFSVNMKSGRPVVPKITNETSEYIAIGKSVYAGSHEIMLAVAGITVPAKYMMELLVDHAKENMLNCSASPAKSCYIIDENGYVVVSNRGYYQTGYFIGYFEGKLVEETQKSGIMEKRTYVDTQADCPQSTTSKTTGTSPGNVLRNFYHNMFQFSYAVVSQTISVLWWIITSLFTANVKVVQSAETKPKNISCTKEIEIYLLKSNLSSVEKTYRCSWQCNQTFTISSIAGTNLALVAVKSACHGFGEKQCPGQIVDNEPKRIEDVNICNRPIRYRRVLPKCYRLTGEYTRACNFQNEHTESGIMIALIVFISVCVAVIIALIFNMYFRKYFHSRCLS